MPLSSSTTQCNSNRLHHTQYTKHYLFILSFHSNTLLNKRFILNTKTPTSRRIQASKVSRLPSEAPPSITSPSLSATRQHAAYCFTKVPHLHHEANSLKAISHLTTSRTPTTHHIPTMPPTQIRTRMYKHSTPPSRRNRFDISISTHGALILWCEEVVSSEFFVVFVLEDYGYVAPVFVCEMIR